MYQNCKIQNQFFAVQYITFVVFNNVTVIGGLMFLPHHVPIFSVSKCFITIELETSIMKDIRINQRKYFLLIFFNIYFLLQKNKIFIYRSNKYFIF